MLLLKQINGEEQPSEVIFKKTPFWIRLCDVPFGKRNVSFAHEIGERLGGFIEFNNSDPLGWEEFMCIKVMLEIDKPLRRGFKVVNRNDETKWVGIQYERLGDFCYLCGRPGHTDRGCQFVDEKDVDKEAMVYQYGPWLVASPRRRNRSSFFDREKERKWIDNLRRKDMSRLSATNVSGGVRLGQSNAARKLTFPSTVNQIKEGIGTEEDGTLESDAERPVRFRKKKDVGEEMRDADGINLKILNNLSIIEEVNKGSTGGKNEYRGNYISKE